MTREALARVRTLVVKVGSNLLAPAGSELDRAFIYGLVGEIAYLRKRGLRLLLVSSGAVAAGMVELGLRERPSSLPVVQATAAVGQAALMQLYREAFAFHSVLVGQVLLTRDGLQERRRYLYARNTMLALLELGVLPVVNENDTVAVDELKLRIGDNDALTVSVGQLVDADCLVLLTDVSGLYDRSPDQEGADLIHNVKQVTPQLMAAAGDAGSGVGSGGIAAKLSAARAASMAGIPLVVADGRREHVLRDILAGDEVGTFFSPGGKRASARRQWLAFSRAPAGVLLVDKGACRALVEGKKSLLPIGVRSVRGEFEQGDTVSIQEHDGREVARGIVNFSAAEARRIAGRRTWELADTLGYDCCDTIVHRDNLVVMQ